MTPDAPVAEAGREKALALLARNGGRYAVPWLIPIPIQWSRSWPPRTVRVRCTTRSRSWR